MPVMREWFLRVPSGRCILYKVVIPPQRFMIPDKNNMNGYDRQHSSEAQSIEDGGRGENNKRKSDDGSSNQTRAKRNRYISIAWCGLPEEAYLSSIILTRAAMNVRGGRSNAMARTHVNAVAIFPWSVSMRPTAAAMASRIRSKNHRS